MTHKLIPAAILAAMLVAPAMAGGHLEFGEWVVTSKPREAAFNRCVESTTDELAKDRDYAEAGDCLAAHINTGEPISGKCETAVREYGNAIELNVRQCVADWEDRGKPKAAGR